MESRTVLAIFMSRAFWKMPADSFGSAPPAGCIASMGRRSPISRKRMPFAAVGFCDGLQKLGLELRRYFEGLVCFTDENGDYCTLGQGFSLYDHFSVHDGTGSELHRLPYTPPGAASWTATAPPPASAGTRPHPRRRRTAPRRSLPQTRNLASES